MMTPAHILLAACIVLLGNGAATKGPENSIATLTSNVQQKLMTPTVKLSRPMVDRKSPLLAALVPTSTDDRTTKVTTASNRDLNLTRDPKSQTPISKLYPPSQLLKEKRAKKGRWNVSSGDVVNGVRQVDENQGSVTGIKDRDSDAQSSAGTSSKKAGGSTDVAESDALADFANVVDNLSPAQMKLILDQLNPQQTNQEDHGSLGVGMMCCLVG